MLWDESNRLLVVNDAPGMQHYIYDATGERVLKANTDTEVVYQNGAFVTNPITFTGYTTYPSAFIVTNQLGVYSKHYYAGSQRIVSRIGDANAMEIFGVHEPRTGSSSDFDDKKLQKTQIAEVKLLAEKVGRKNVFFKEFKPYTYEEIQQLIEEENKDDARPAVVVQQAPLLQPLYFYHPDHLGTSTALTDINGDAYQFFLNLPFGETMAEQLPSSYYQTPYKFNGKELDDETGLYYYGARYYDPKISIWYSVDPLKEKYPGISPYVYCLNNPINFIDPDGRDVITWKVYDVDNNRMPATRGYASKNFVNAMTHFAKTDYGKSYLLQFMKKGQSVYGITAKENGKFSDKDLNLYDLTLEKASPSERGAVFVESDGSAWEGMTVFPNSKDDMSLNVYFENVNGQNSTTTLGETIAHEFGLHGNKYEQYIDAILKGKSFKDIQSGTKDHEGLMNSDSKNKSYQIYKKIMDQLIKIDSNYKEKMENDHKREHK